MTEIKKFKRGNRTYTRMGKFREVRLEGQAPPPTPASAPPKNIQIDMDARMEAGPYSNIAVVRRSQEEVIVDFAFVPPNVPRGKVVSRVILSPKHAKALSALLKEASDEKK